MASETTNPGGSHEVAYKLAHTIAAYERDHVKQEQDRKYWLKLMNECHQIVVRGLNAG